MLKASLKTTTEWKTINWAKVQRKVFKLQKRIYKAVEIGDRAKAHNLQKLLVKSYYAKLLAVRKVTQDNSGKKTAGVDGKKSLTPFERMTLSKNLDIKGYKAKPLRRVYISKPNGEKRPLGIPTLKDRAMQALIKMGLEPYWEAQFEENSYGFRPGRSVHDAIQMIFINIHQKAKWVLDADIEKCFDKIDHKMLLNDMRCPHFRGIIKQWLKCGVIDSGFQETTSGTPQGGVISPLLANIALHGMSTHIEKHVKGTKVIRYADDFVIFGNTRKDIVFAEARATDFLESYGLRIKESKTRTVHTSEGFDFLGFNVRQYKVGKYKSGKIAKGNQWSGYKGNKPLGFKTLIKPSKKAIQKHYDHLKEVIIQYKKAPQEALISKLNPIIRGWSNYYSTEISSKIFSQLDHLLLRALRGWVKSRTKKANYKNLRKYFGTKGSNNWTFQTPEKMSMLRHAETKIVRHIKVQGKRSPYDGDLIYWSKRGMKLPGVKTRVKNLLKRQKGVCPVCKQLFMPDDLMEVDHIIPTSMGGKDWYTNLQLLHKHCHDFKTARDGSIASRIDDMPF
ncbi:MAG: group II intron reverse transcriptase/maturase [Symploca sp. SIO2D2]|nr:group II intron reverse transcriptase/maturase [Symploca sp. SIO2D2]